MELPKCYFPKQLCPYSDEVMQQNSIERKRCMKFSDYGSHGGLHFMDSNETSCCLPQYSQSGIKNLSVCGFSLPLFEKPLTCKPSDLMLLALNHCVFKSR